MLGSILFNAELLNPGTIITQKKTGKDFQEFFKVGTVHFEVTNRLGRVVSTDKKVAFCSDIDGLFLSQSVEHRPDDWRLFMDSSSTSFKCFLLHNEEDVSKRLPSVLVFIGKGVPEKYAVVEQVLSILNYTRYQWKVQADLKMINIISGLMAASC